MNNINVLIGGDLKLLPDNLEKFPGEWVGVDYGSFYLSQRDDLEKLFALGDFDSVDKIKLSQIEAAFSEVIKLNPIKDDTDTEAALQVVFKKYPDAHIRVFGATGGRIDHLLSNLFLVLQKRFNPFVGQIEFIDCQNVVKFFAPGFYELDRITSFKYLSFITLSDVSGLTLINEKYKLKNYKNNGVRAFVSNEFLDDKAKFEFSEGIVAVIYSKDKQKKVGF